MLPSTPNGTSNYPVDGFYTGDGAYSAAINQQIEEEELKFKAAMQADKPFEEVKAIREKIKELKKLLQIC